MAGGEFLEEHCHPAENYPSGRSMDPFQPLARAQCEESGKDSAQSELLSRSPDSYLLTWVMWTPSNTSQCPVPLSPKLEGQLCQVPMGLGK